MKPRTLLLAVVVALACVALAGLPAWASDSGRASGKAGVSIDSVRIGSKAGPLAVRVQAGPYISLKLWLNGRPVDHSFEIAAGRTQDIELTRGDGLRPGPNRLRLRAARTGKMAPSFSSRTVRMPAGVLFADAGDDLAGTVKVRARFGTAPAVGGPTDSTYRWRIVSKTVGARATLADRAQPRPQLHPKTPGTFQLQLEADPDGPGPAPASYDQVTVTSSPDDPPIGASLNTLGDRGAIVIDGKPYGTSSKDRTAYAVLERTTRAVVASGDVSADPSGFKTLYDLADQYGTGANKLKYLMIVSGPSMYDWVGAYFGPFTKYLGVPLLSEEDYASFGPDHGYSVVGIPGAPPGGGTIRIAAYGPSTPPVSGAITGYLQKLQAVDFEGTPVYDLVTGENPTFDTRAESTAITNRMIVNGKSYFTSFFPGTSGFQVAVFESLSLAPLTTFAVATNEATGSNQALQEKAAAKLKEAIDAPWSPLFFVQTIGKPKAAGPQWAGVVEQLARLGANRQLVNALDGTTEYSLVGRRDSEEPPAEASTAYDHNPPQPAPAYPPARLVGALAHTRTSVFAPTVTGTPSTAGIPQGLNGMVNVGLIELAYQKQRPWPTLPGVTPAEEVAAEAFICTRLGFCQSVVEKSCRTLRACYWKKYDDGTVWGDVYTQLTRVDFASGQGFEKGSFDKMKAELEAEITALNVVRGYLPRLTKPFEQTEGAAILDLKSISDKVWEAVQRPAASNSDAWALGLIGKVVALGGFAGPPGSAVAAGLSAAFGLASYLSNESGQPILGAEIKAEASELGKALNERVTLARQEAGGLGRLIASDYGKLMDAYDHIRVKADWAFDENALTMATLMRTASRQWFYESLVPVAYPYLIRANNNARVLDCKIPGWPNEPDSTQMWATVGYDNNANPIKGMFFFARGRGGASSPLASIGLDMFRPRGPDPATSGLGIEKLSFFTPRVFGGKIAHAVNTGDGCELGGIPDLR